MVSFGVGTRLIVPVLPLAFMSKVGILDDHWIQFEKKSLKYRQMFKFSNDFCLNAQNTS